jgi:hypothetical protein
MPEVYVPETVQQIKQVYGELIYDHRQSVYEHLMILAKRLWQSFQTGNPVVYSVINNYHPDFLGASAAIIRSKKWSLADFEYLLAVEHGFQNASDLSIKGKESLHASFEQAVDALLRGDLTLLKLLIEHEPPLSQQRSQYGHHATLLHYAASNGVELYRQQVPLSLPEIVQYLIEKGADPNMKMRVYNDKFDVKALLASSTHPEDAGIKDELLKVLA